MNPAPDFIRVVAGTVQAQARAGIVVRLREVEQSLHPGRIGGGVFPDLKYSRGRQAAGNLLFASANRPPRPLRPLKAPVRG